MAVEVPLDLLHSSLLVDVMASASKSAILILHEGSAMLSLVLVTQNGPSLGLVQLIVSFAFLLAMGQRAIVAEAADAMLAELSAEEVWLDLLVDRVRGLGLSVAIEVGVPLRI